LSYIDSKNNDAFASKEKLNYWKQVDWYNGGMEHVTRHLLYSRFWHRFLYDIGEVPTKEPYAKRTAQGLILGNDGDKMSKSKGNVVNPNDIIEEFGADTLRTYVMFIGDYEKPVPWNDNSVKGSKRFLDRVWKLQEMITNQDGFSKELETSMHRTIKKVSQDLEEMKYNTAVAALMTLINEFYDNGSVTKDELKAFIILLNPIAPHITEEIWSIQGYEGMLNQTQWPEWDENKTIEDVIEIPVQINGKVRAKVNVPKDAEQSIVKKAVMDDDNVKMFIDDKKIVKEIFVPGKIYNIVVK
jgi:leucyl-tRNA synthetase